MHESLEPFPFPHATTIATGHKYRLLLSEQSVATGVLPHQQWRVRFVGPALVTAALSWYGPASGFVVEFVLPLAGHYTVELLLEFKNDTRLDGMNPLCADNALHRCYKSGILPGDPAGRSWDSLGSNASTVDCMDAGDVKACASLTPVETGLLSSSFSVVIVVLLDSWQI